jgi:dihydroxyacetone kinase-like protein
MVNSDKLVNILFHIADIIKENKDHLTELDQAIGDGDHGINLDRGFSAVKEHFLSTKDNIPKDLGLILSKTAMILISKVGGASGPLYGTAIMKASNIVSKKEEMNLLDGLNMLEAAIQGIKERGKAEQGDKTMLDTLIPTLTTLKDCINKKLTNDEIKKYVLESAKKGMKSTKEYSANKGRASYLGARSIGHIDPGAKSSYLIIKAIINTID